MHSTEVDDIRMVLGNEIISVFSENSKYSVNPDIYKESETNIENLSSYLPQITKMSEELQESWIKLISY